MKIAAELYLEMLVRLWLRGDNVAVRWKLDVCYGRDTDTNTNQQDIEINNELENT